MKTVVWSAIFFLIVTFNNTISSQSSKTLLLPEPVQIELKRLDEAYNILDQYSGEVWKGWNDYLNFPFLMTFQNGLRVLVGHPAPPSEFVSLPGIKVHGLAIHIDTTKMNNFMIKLPLTCGGGILSLGSFNSKPVTIVDLRFNEPTSQKPDTSGTMQGENHVLVFIHELMHCYQNKILFTHYGNFRINPDLNYALYSDIEGQSLSLAYKQTSPVEALQYLKDFCIARSFKKQDLTRSEKSQLSSDEFREGEAVYSEYTILQCLKKGFRSSVIQGSDPEYKQFANPGNYFNRYQTQLNESTGKTLDPTGKFYSYGCFQALLLQRFFPGWQKDVEDGEWLDQIIRKKLNITSGDSLLVLKRFQNIYHFDELKVKHGNVISERNDTYKKFIARKGRSYIISTKPISQYLSQLIDKSAKNYNLGLINMYPDGIGDIQFNGVSLSMKPVPTEINELFYLKVVDINPNRPENPFTMTFKSKDNNGFYYNVIISTPHFTLKAPKVTIRESNERVKFIIHSRI